MAQQLERCGWPVIRFDYFNNCRSSAGLAKQTALKQKINLLLRINDQTFFEKQIAVTIVTVIRHWLPDDNLGSVKFVHLQRKRSFQGLMGQQDKQ